MATVPVLAGCKVELRPADPAHYAPQAYYLVTPVWADVDRPDSFGWSCGPNRKLAERLQAAVLAGVALTDPEVRVDCNGATYVEAKSQVLGRIMNADLKRLGF
jgi:hypothetical protein